MCTDPGSDGYSDSARGDPITNIHQVETSYNGPRPNNEKAKVICILFVLINKKLHIKKTILPLKSKP